MNDSNLIDVTEQKEHENACAWARATMILLLGILGALIVISLCMYYSIHSVQTDASFCYEQLTRNKQIIERLKPLHEERTMIQERQNLLDAWDQPCFLRQCLEHTAASIPDDARLVRAVCDEGGCILLDGQALNAPAVMQFLDALRASEWVKHASLEQLQQESAADNKQAAVLFRIKVEGIKD